MTDQTAGMSHRRYARTPVAEFRVYFALILAAALPFETIAWAIASLRAGRPADKGPLARALQTARIITPTIFSA